MLNKDESNASNGKSEQQLEEWEQRLKKRKSVQLTREDGFRRQQLKWEDELDERSKLLSEREQRMELREQLLLARERKCDEEREKLTFGAKTAPNDKPEKVTKTTELHQLKEEIGGK